ncbi:MAG TPA: hypothetical protein VEW68_04290, partial [Patescibacteria group bacterium]|nr:hypothetical protein [Patescibacteria group bacterium]
MQTELGAVYVQVLHRRHAVRLELAAMHDQDFVTRVSKLLDDRPADEARAAEDGDSHPAFAAYGFLFTMTSIKPQSFACSGVMK